MNDLPATQGAGRGSSAAPFPAPAPPSPPGARWPLGAQWTNRLTGALLFSAAVMTCVAAMPAALRAFGVGSVPTASRGAGRIGPLLPRGGASRAELPAPEPEEDDEPSEPSRLRIGIAPRALKLLDEPGPGSATVGEIAAGEPVMIVREQGGWALIARNGDDGVVMGWARRSEIAVR